jgi:hypothetical protein
MEAAFTEVASTELASTVLVSTVLVSTEPALGAAASPGAVAFGDGVDRL